MRRAITSAHLVAVALAAGAIGILFLREPVLGDDLTYWSCAFHLHEQGLRAWGELSLYDLRWPVWSVCWLLQILFGPGLISYWGAAIFYLAGGALLAFWLGKFFPNSASALWAGSIAFIFHPFLDPVSYCPMPDLSEAVWGAAAILAWWKLMQAASAQARMDFRRAAWSFRFHSGSESRDRTLHRAGARAWHGLVFPAPFRMADRGRAFHSAALRRGVRLLSSSLWRLAA